MKIFSILVTIIAIGLISFNVGQIDLNAPFQGESVVALITIFTSLCAVLLVHILRISKRIEQKHKTK